MQRQLANEFDHSTLEAMMARYRAELLRYQRATPPGKPTLAQNLNEITKDKEVYPQAKNQNLAAQPKAVPKVETEPILLSAPPKKLVQQINIIPPQPKQEEARVALDKVLPPPELVQQTDIIPPQPKKQEELVADDQTLLSQEPLLQTDIVPTQPKEEARDAEEKALPQQLLTNEVLDKAATEEKELLSQFEPERALPPAPPSIMLPFEKKSAPIPPIELPEHCLCNGHTEFEKCVGAYGTFRPYERMGKYTTASFVQTPGEATPVLVRFAADVPIGGADAIRCRRSFSVKFFCSEGEYDLFGMHLPVSVGTTKKTLADCCAASRADPKTGLRSRAAFWEFLVTHTEALHAAMWLYSDLGTIGSYRTIDGYGLPCIWVNSKGEHRAVRTRWLSRQRPQTLTRFEAEELAGSDPDAVSRDLIETIQAGDRPQYELCIQTIEPEQLSEVTFDPFDPTVIWPVEQFKPRRIGLLALERLPDHFENELLCSRFEESHIIPGIEYPPPPSNTGEDFTQARQYLRSLGEFSRHRLIDNLAEELMRMPPLLLEQVLILFSRADLEFGQAMTLALGG